MSRRTDFYDDPETPAANSLVPSVNVVVVNDGDSLEESGIGCEIAGIIGIYSDPGHVILYTSNGEVPQEFSIVLTARALSGRPMPNSESSEVRWAPIPEVLSYTMDRSMRIRINDFLAQGKSPAIN